MNVFTDLPFPTDTDILDSRVTGMQLCLQIVMSVYILHHEILFVCLPVHLFVLAIGTKEVPRTLLPSV